MRLQESLLVLTVSNILICDGRFSLLQLEIWVTSMLFLRFRNGSSCYLCIIFMIPLEQPPLNLTILICSAVHMFTKKNVV